MPIDPTGTAPGVTPTPELPETVNMRCRNPKCSSIQAMVIQIPGQSAQRLYRCAKCHHSWGINVGGYTNEG